MVDEKSRYNSSGHVEARRRLTRMVNDWARFRIADIGDVTGAGVDKKIVENEVKVHLVNYTDVYKRTYLMGSDLNHQVTATKGKARQCDVKAGDIFFTPTSETPDDIARSAVALENIPEAVYSYHVIRLRLFKPDAPGFWAHVFETEDFRRQSRQYAEGSGTRYVITLNKFRNMEISVPGAEEREAIGTILHDMHSEIHCLEDHLSKVRVVNLAATQDLLASRRRLPGFTGDWDKVRLKDYTVTGAGNSSLIKGTLKKADRIGGYPAYSASGPDLMLDFYEQEGDAIIISAVGARCGKSFRACGKWSAIANTHILRCLEGLEVDFAFNYMKCEDFWLKGGTGQPFVLVRRTLERPFLLPPVKEQRAIAEIIKDLDAEIQALETRLAKARCIKEGMMQRLLNVR